MTKRELEDAFTIAKAGNAGFPQDNTFDGFGLPDFQPVHCTRQQIATLIVWQCAQFNGQWNYEALQEIAAAGRRKFIVIG